jgi:hypothetical protein
MRNLTLDEKISLKGVFEAKEITGIIKMNVHDAVSFFNMCFGPRAYICNWHLYPRFFKYNYCSVDIVDPKRPIIWSN